MANAWPYHTQGCVVDAKLDLLPTMLRISDVERATGLRRAAIYARIARGEFPAPCRISSRHSVWPADEIKAWLAALPRGTRPVRSGARRTVVVDTANEIAIVAA